jgi:hypothetical protein
MTKIQHCVNIGFVISSILLVVQFVSYAFLKVQIGFAEERIEHFREIVRLYKQDPKESEYEEMQNAITVYYPEGSDFIFNRALRELVEISRSNHIVILEQIKSQSEEK